MQNKTTSGKLCRGIARAAATKGESNRPGGIIPEKDGSQEQLADHASQARDPKGRAHSATLSAAGPTKD